MSQSLGIVGRGNIGSALGQIFSDVGWSVNYFDSAKTKCTVNSLVELASFSQIIIIAVPSWSNRAIAEALAAEAKNKLVLTVAKGVEPGFVTMDKVLESVSQGRFDYGVIYGPMLASEISKGLPAAAILARSGNTSKQILPSTSRLKLVYGDDPHTIALCGVLKNIYAISLGINDGLGYGHNSKGSLAVNIMQEFVQLLNDLGGDPSQAYGLAGLGDLLATGWSDLSFNHRIGRLIVKDPTIKPKGEGVSSLQELPKVIKLSHYPIVHMTYKIVSGKSEANSLRKLV